MIVSAYCHSEWGDVITLPTSNSRGNVDKMWQCNKVSQATLLHRPLQKSQEISGTEFGDENTNISDMMWECIYIENGESGNSITSPTAKIIGNIGH